MKVTTRKLLAGAMAALTLLGSLQTPALAVTIQVENSADSSGFSYIQHGDIDMNGHVGARDALIALQYAANAYDGILTDTQLDLADVNGDGAITAEDAYLIISCTAGTLTGGLRVPEFKSNGTIWIAGDSIAEGGAKYGASYIGWGQVIGDYLTSDATVHNTAYSGRSAKSFTQEENYTQIMDGMKPGDVLFIAFGHNDTKGPASPDEDSETVGSYKHYLKYYYIEPALRAGVLPILMTSVSRAYNVESGKEAQYHWKYICAARELAAEYHAKGIAIPFIDMFQLTWAEYSRIGTYAAKRTYHASDDIHYNRYGAQWCAQIILSQVKKQGIDLAGYMK